MTNETEEKIVVSKVEITPETMREVCELLIADDWFERQDDGTIIDENGDEVEFDVIVRGVEHWFRCLLEEVSTGPSWYMGGRSGWPDFETRPTCSKYWCYEKPIDGSHWCQCHFDEDKEFELRKLEEVS